MSGSWISRLARWNLDEANAATSEGTLFAMGVESATNKRMPLPLADYRSARDGGSSSRSSRAKYLQAVLHEKTRLAAAEQTLRAAQLDELQAKLQAERELSDFRLAVEAARLTDKSLLEEDVIHPRVEEWRASVSSPPLPQSPMVGDGVSWTIVRFCPFLEGSRQSLLLHLSSPFGAGSRAEVVDAEEYKANCPAVLGARNFFHFQIETSPRRARQSFSYFINRQSRSFQEIVSFSLFDFLDSFQTLKAQKMRKHNLDEKSENQRVTADRRRRPLGLVTHRQKALDARSSTINKTRQCHDDRRHTVLSKVRESERISQIPFQSSIQKKFSHFRPCRPGRGCRGT